MKSIKHILAIVIAVGITIGCGAANENGAEKQNIVESIKELAFEKQNKALIASLNLCNNEFAFDLYGKLRAEKGNLFFSPYSISTAMAMAYAGARGQTNIEMAKAMHFETGTQFHSAFGEIIKSINTGGQKGKYELITANALWGQKGYEFLKEYIELIKTDYEGNLNQVDFIQETESARNTINAWVEKQTKDKIKDLIARGSLTPMTRLVITNAVYFKGNWARQFEKDSTADAPFNLTDDKNVGVPMMNKTAEFGYAEKEDFQILEMPYVDNELSMFILLPQKTDGVGELEKNLTQQNFAKWSAEMRKQKVIVSMPKFKTTSQFGLADTLKSMGMMEAFTDKADFSGMDGKRDLFISAVIHKAFVEVNEQGTEAAATGIMVGATSIGMKIPVFKADRPFVFLIRDNNTGVILFFGRIMNPKS